MKKNIYPILAIALVLRLMSINQSFWLDEATSATIARDMSFGEFFTNFLPGDFHPAGYYLILKSWARIFGSSEVSLRMVSVLAGVATVYFVYKIGSRIKDESVGLIAAILMATAPLHIYYSQEVRMYAMSTLASTLTLYYYLKLQKKPEKSDWIKFSLSVAFIIFIDYLPLLMLAPIWTHAIITKRKSKNKWLKKLAMHHIPLIIVFMASYPYFSQQLSAGLAVKSNAAEWWNILGKTNPKNLGLVPVKFLLGRISFANKSTYAAVIILASSVYGYAALLSKKDFSKSKIIYLWAVLPLALGAFIGLFIPVMTYFRFIFVLPAIYIVAALGISNSKEKVFPLLLASALILNGWFSITYSSNFRFHREDWRRLSRFVVEESLFTTPTILFPSNSQMEAINYYTKDKDILVLGNDDIDKITDNVYLARYVIDVVDPTDSTRLKIEELGYQKISEHDFNGVILWKYRKPAVTPSEILINEGEEVSI